jgi:hypothetical protein
MQMEDRLAKSHQKFFKDHSKMFRAYHEAGHAVMCYFLKKKFSYVTIRKVIKNNNSGCVKYGEFRWCFHKEQRNYRQHIKRAICIFWAGFAAERIILSSQNYSPDIIDSLLKIVIDDYCFSSGENSDADIIDRFLPCLANNDVDLSFKIQDECTIKTENLLVNNWEAVEALANELLSRNKKIKYMEARKIIKDALANRRETHA